MISFVGSKKRCPVTGEVIYLRNEGSFQTTPPPPFWSSLEINTLEIALDVTGQVTGVWGYCPYQSWKQKELSLPTFHAGGVKCNGIPDFQSRMSHLLDNKKWEICVDQSLGWVCIGDPDNTYAFFEVVNGLVVGIKANTLRSLWIKVGENRDTSGHTLECQQNVPLC
jgi:hypothetical protein